MNPRLQALRARLSRFRPSGGLRPWITLVSLGFVLAALLSHGRQLLQLSLDRQGWLWLLLGVGVSLLSLIVNGLAWTVILRWLGARPRWERGVALHVGTNLRKYLPGGIWHIASRVQVLRQGAAAGPVAPLADPLSTPLALFACLLDPLLAAMAALALVAAGGLQFGLGLLALLPLLLLRPRWLQPMLRRLERRRARELGLAEEEGAPAPAPAPPSAQPGPELALPGAPWLPLLVELLFVLLRFAAFACCVLAFDLQLSLDWPTWLAGFALAWTAGLVVPGAPGGLGVFEAVLLLRLGVALPEPSVLAVALAYRLICTLTDLLAAGLVHLDGRVEKALVRSQ
jgi:uncharacterized membrane protein YbhN (UPF0104 family)